jgi:hypothetical protein
VLVTSPAPMSIQEVLYFSDRLVEAKMPRGAFVVNRMRKPPAHAGETVSVDEVTEAIRASGVKLDDDAASRLVTAHADATKLAALDALHVNKLDARSGGGVPIVRIPELPTDVHDLTMLGALGELLLRT